jgi:hypothetical protein
MACVHSTSSSSSSGSLRSAGILFLAAALLAGCGAPQAPAARPGPRTLPPDSAALLREAIRQARPAYATQNEALRAGIYAPPALAQRSAPPLMPSAPAPAPHAVPAGGSLFVIQIAAVRDLALAQARASAAGEHFPELEVLIEATGEHFRIALVGWTEPASARAALPAVQQLYPDAWLRRAGP